MHHTTAAITTATTMIPIMIFGFYWTNLFSGDIPGLVRSPVHIYFVSSYLFVQKYYIKSNDNWRGTDCAWSFYISSVGTGLGDRQRDIIRTDI